MSWQKVTLQEVVTTIQTGPFGSQLHQSDYSNDGIPVIMPKDLIDGKISVTSIARVSKDHVSRLSRHKISEGDILYSRRGDVGRCAYVKKEESGWICGTGCLRVSVNKEKVDSKFLFFYLQIPEIKIWLENNAIGSTMPNLNTTILGSVPLFIPPLYIQKKIANILSAYDDLIENNQKQIQLLEEAAQRLYKEWFVDLRFPGHENTRIVDGVPEGWEKFPFSSKVSIMSGGTPKTTNKSFYEGEIPFYTPKDYPNNFFVFDTELHISNDGLLNCNSAYFPSGTIIITARGTVGKTVILGIPMAMNQSCYALKSDDLGTPYYLFFSINQEVSKLKVMSNGGVFNTIITKTFDNIHITIPNNNLHKNFDNNINFIMEKIKKLLQQNKLLQEMRNTLLPKLIK